MPRAKATSSTNSPSLSRKANETEYWLLLLLETGYLTSKEADSILIDNMVVIRLLTSIIKSTKRKLQP